MAVFTTAQDRIVPDPLLYSEWFDQAGEERRRLAVGSRRYSEMQSLLGVMSASLEDGREIEFAANPHTTADEVLLMVDPNRLAVADAGRAESEEKMRRFREFVKRNEPIQAPIVNLRDDGTVGFTDGRHRFAVLRDQRASRVAVMVARNQSAKFQEVFGARPPQRHGQHVRWEHFLDPKTGDLLSIDQLRREGQRGREARVAAVRKQLAATRKALKQTTVYGFGKSA